MKRPLTIVLVLATAAATGLPAAALAAAPAPGSRHRPLVVDDDGAQCGRASYTTIGEAVAAARPGDRVRVCPCRYAERVVVDEPVTVTGTPGAVAALDCQAAEDVDTSGLVVLEPPDDEETPVLRIDADDVTVEGLVLQGVDDQVPDVVDGFTLFDAALTVDDTHSGWRIRRNLFQRNFLAAELGSDGAETSRFEGNCLRDDEFGVANQRYTLADARLRGNETVRSGTTGWELGWGYRGTTDVRLEDNTSVDDAVYGVYVENARRLLLRGNTVRGAGIGMNLAGGSTGVRIVDNTLTGTRSGAAIGVNLTPDDPAPVRGLVVRGNTMTGNTFSGLAAGALTNLSGAAVVGNTSSGNGRSGIQLPPGTRGNLLAGNVTEGNGTFGILLFAGTEDNLVVGNRMLGNGVADAADQTGTDRATLANTWVGNDCATDLPPGAIC